MGFVCLKFGHLVVLASFIKNAFYFPVALLLFFFFLRKKTYWLYMCSSVSELWFSSIESSFCHSYSLVVIVYITIYSKSWGQVVLSPSVLFFSFNICFFHALWSFTWIFRTTLLISVKYSAGTMSTPYVQILIS